MSSVYDLPDAKSLAIEAINNLPEDMSVRDVRRHLNKTLKNADAKGSDIKVDTIAGFCLSLIVLTAIVYAVNS